MKRAISIDELLKTRRRILNFEGGWLSHIGKPELKGSWLIWGNSGNGKTSYALQLAKYLTNFERVAYNSLEEGNSQTFAEACQRNGLAECRKRFVLICDYYEDLTERLAQHKSPNVIIIDSLQYFGLSYEKYKKLLEKFPQKLFIFISHADGKMPEGRVAKKVRFDAAVKVFAEGCQAFAMSRYGGDKPFEIWAEGKKKFNLLEK